jgi:flagella basal body P-ring formation protein FlgA
MRSLLILAAALAAIAGPALAGQPVTLKADTVDSDGVVTLGDLFDGAGAAAGVAVAAKPGRGHCLGRYRRPGAGRRSGLDWANVEGIRRIVVRGGVATASATSPRGNVDVLTYARNLVAGEIVQPADLVWGKAAATPGRRALGSRHGHRHGRQARAPRRGHGLGSRRRRGPGRQGGRHHHRAL